MAIASPSPGFVCARGVRLLSALAAAVVLGAGSLGCDGSAAEGPSAGSAANDGGALVDASADVSPPGRLDGALAYDGPCAISASDFNQSCTVDTDCVEVTSTNYCAANCQCGGSAINADAMAEFDDRVGKTPLGSGALGAVGCPCLESPGPCCRDGQCTVLCVSSSDTLAACADAGGTCNLGGHCVAMGPPDACAYSDETCCVPQ